MNLKDLGIPVDVGQVYEGERIRGNDVFVEMGGPKIQYKFELVQVKGESEITDGKVEVIGNDVDKIKEGDKIPFGILVEIYGKDLDKGLEPIFERRVHDFTNYIHGVMHLNQRQDIWLRMSKEVKNAGLRFEHIGKVLWFLYTKEYKQIEKAQVKIITDESKVLEYLSIAMSVYKERDDRIKGMKDSEVEEFYGCTLCQSFAPNHICIVTPQRISLCGALTWLDCKASYKMDPNGPNFPVKKGEIINKEKGEYTGVNETIKEYSHGKIEHLYLYSMFTYPHTSCGCFEAIAFYIPEVDSIGICDRNFSETAVNGLKFSNMASQSGGGEQVEGFLGFGIQWMGSEKFFSGDGGWKRIAWMPSYLKERAKENMGEMYEKIATEKDASDIESLKKFMKERNHPMMLKLQQAEQPQEKTGVLMEPPEETKVPVALNFSEVSMPSSYPGVKIILKEARIYAKKLIIIKE